MQFTRENVGAYLLSELIDENSRVNASDVAREFGVDASYAGRCVKCWFLDNGEFVRHGSKRGPGTYLDKGTVKEGDY